MFPESRPAAKKSLGQNFLCDANIARKIVDLLEAGPEDRVLEIGPGQGALTRILAARPLRSLCALEKDRHWAVALRAVVPRLAVCLGDAMFMDWPRLQKGRPWKVVGNLPYNIASPLLWDMAAAGGFSRGVFMVQKEVAQRLASGPHSKKYGALTVWVQSFATVRLAFTVGPQVFRPQPKVDSAVVVIEPRTQPLSVDQRALSHLLHGCFQKRRKQLRPILKPLYGDCDNMLGLVNLSGKERPEDISVEQFAMLANALKSGIPA